MPTPNPTRIRDPTAFVVPPGPYAAYPGTRHYTAERALRHAVLWRRSSHGTHSEEGSRFVERMLTVRATLRAQGRNVLDYVTQAVDNSLRGSPAPSLLPETSRDQLALAA